MSIGVNIFRVVVVCLTAASIGIGLLAFAVVNSSNAGLDAAVKEGFETIPEAVMMIMGFKTAPLVVTIGYWIALIALLFLAFRPTPK
jgi:hypothetical protein